MNFPALIFLLVPIFAFAGGSTGTMSTQIGNIDAATPSSHQSGTMNSKAGSWRLAGSLTLQAIDQNLRGGFTSPNWFQADHVDENFDGSVTFLNPRVKAQGQMLRIGASTRGYNTSGVGLCAALGKGFVAYDTTLKTENELLVLINENGTLSAVYNSNNYDIIPLERVTCR